MLSSLVSIDRFELFLRIETSSNLREREIDRREREKLIEEREREREKKREK